MFGHFDEDIDVYAPDILMIHFGIDDAYQPVYRSEFKENLVQIVRLARKRFNPEIILLTSHPFDNQYEMEMIYIYYRVIREVAVDLSCDLIPVHAYWAGLLKRRDYRLRIMFRRIIGIRMKRGMSYMRMLSSPKIENILKKKQI